MSANTITKNSLENGFFKDGQLVFGNIFENDGSISAEYDGVMSFGSITGSGTDCSIQASCAGAIAHGRVHGNNNANNNIKSCGPAAEAGGFVNGRLDDSKNNYIQAEYSGAIAKGRTEDNNSYIKSSGPGAVARGRAQNGANIHAECSGATAAGKANGENSKIKSDGSGSIAVGYINGDNSRIESYGAGLTYGYIEGSGSYMESSSDYGASAHGYIHGNESRILAKGAGSTAFGCVIQDSENGIIPNTNYSFIKASSKGSLAGGIVEHSSNYIWASGKGSFAFGKDKLFVHGTGSTAFGGNNVVKGKYSQAFGYGINVLSDYSHAEGYYTEASSDAAEGSAHAEGSYTRSYGHNSHAEGYNTIASGATSHTEGYKSKAAGIATHAEGLDTSVGIKQHKTYIGAYKWVDDIHDPGETHGELLTTTYYGQYVIIDLNSDYSDDFKNVLYGGIILYDGIEYTSVNRSDLFRKYIGGEEFVYNMCFLDKKLNGTGGSLYKCDGVGSHTEGSYSYAPYNHSHAEGYRTEASAFYGMAHAEGSYTEAAGVYSHAEGYRTKAGNKEYNVRGSHSEGYYTEASEDYSHAEGTRTFAISPGSHAEGGQTHANGDYSHAEGYKSNVKGDYAHAEGSKTNANGDYSHTEGYNTYTGYEKNYNDLKAGDDYGYDNGTYAHAEGNATIAYGPCSHAEGNKTFASKYAHAEGNATIATGESSHAEGNNTEAKGNHSHSEGNGVKALGENSHAEGDGYYTQSTQSSWTFHDRPGGGHYVVYKTKETWADSEGAAQGHDFSWEEPYINYINVWRKVVHNDPVHDSDGWHGAFKIYFDAAPMYRGEYGKFTILIAGYAMGKNSHINGLGTRADTANVTAIGTYNNETQTDDLFVVGNGIFKPGYAWPVNPSNVFRVTKNGVYANTTTMNTYADYAEFFEWDDQNKNDEDRIGYFVQMADNEKIKIATNTNDTIGVISGCSSIIGNSAEEEWDKKYLRDIYGRLIYDIDSSTGEKIPKINPEYVRKKYIPRSQRKEWAVVGLIGQLIVRDDGTCIPGKRCGVTKDGIATHATKGFRVLKRLDDNHIKVLILGN